MSKDLTKVLIKPLLSEKSYIETEQVVTRKDKEASKDGKIVKTEAVVNKYRFAVAPDANKIAIRKAVEAMFGVKVTSVNTSTVPGKKKRFGRYSSKGSAWKKAVVTLAEGESLDFFEKFDNE